MKVDEECIVLCHCLVRRGSYQEVHLPDSMFWLKGDVGDSVSGGLGSWTGVTFEGWTALVCK